MSEQDERYLEAQGQFGPALERLARAYEADGELWRDLLQEVHVAVWRSLAGFAGQCSLRTWVYRVAHNVGASHVRTRMRAKPGLVDLGVAMSLPTTDDPEAQAGDRQALARLMALIHGLEPTDRQVMLLYLENLPAAAIGEITGLTPGAVAVKIHRAKTVMARRFNLGDGA